ncbi:MAG: cupredoxin domain-containing protein [Nitrososphaerota archaeon]
MKLGIILLITISGVLLASSLHQADSELLASGKYLLQGSGFAATEESIDDSRLDLQFSTGNLVNTRMKVTLQDGLISLENDDYVASGGWTGTVLSNGRFISLSGNAENINGDRISLSLLARLVQNSKDASVYTITGKLTQNGESTKLIYNAKVIGSSFIFGETPTQQQTPKEKTVQISILLGSSDLGNIQYYSLSTIQITPGTTIVWKNDDTVSHRIMSGVASFSPGKPFKPDGKIDSGDIAPGQTFTVKINELGITRFFDTTYYWMDGVIVSLPETGSKSLKTTETALEKAQKYK